MSQMLNLEFERAQAGPQAAQPVVEDHLVAGESQQDTSPEEDPSVSSE